MKQLITAALVAASFDESQGVPSEIIYLPEGDNPITATVNGKPESILVSVPRERGPKIAAKLQADLEKRQGENVRPWFSFQHQPGPASALPQSFRYEPGKGVMVAVEWTGAGRSAIEGKDFSYFSPTFLRDDDGTPGGLPVKGEFGALVNEPAFRNIQRIAAADAGSGLSGDSAIDKIEAKARQLVESGQAVDLDQGIVIAIDRNPDLYRAAICADPVRKETLLQIEKMKDAGKESPLDQLQALKNEIYLKGEAPNSTDAFVKAATRRPDLYQAWQDEMGDRIEEWMEDFSQGPSQHAVSASAFEAKAHALVTAGEAANVDEAFALVAASDPASYSAYLNTLRG